MKLMMKTLAAGPDFVYDKGKECDVPIEVARGFQSFWDGMSPQQSPPEKTPENKGKENT